jgi:membrane-associated phospholipid phosphatase
MYFCYSSYYFLIPVVGFALYLRSRDRSSDVPGAAFRKFMLAVSLTFWVCYLHFLFTPAGGPVFWPAYPGPVLDLRGGPITAVEQWVFRHGTIVGGAFPSSHVAVAFVAAWFAVRFSVVPAVLVPLSIGLAISTVYAGYHYGVDVLYGIIIGAVVTAISGKVFDWREKTRTVRSGAGPAGRPGEGRRACDL